MPETTREIVRLLKAAKNALTQSDHPDDNALSEAGAALEETVAELPQDVPGIGSLLSLALEALQGAYIGTIDRDHAVASATRAITAAAAQIDAPGAEAAAEVDAAGAALWALLQRDPELSPF
ncbi:MAG: hypothetical protein ACOCZ7_04475, partial [Armatimonadota bacterium]